MWKRLHALGVVCVQEHNLPRHKEAQLTKTAKARCYTLIITFGGADDDTSERKGVLIIQKNFAKFFGPRMFIRS